MEEEDVDAVVEAEEEGGEAVAVVEEVAEEDVATTVITAGVEAITRTATKAANQQVEMEYKDRITIETSLSLGGIILTF